MASIEINGKRGEARKGRSLLAMAAELGAPLAASCFGAGLCRECLLEVCEGGEALSAKSEEEQFLRGDFRLACQAVIQHPALSIKARSPRRGRPRILVTELPAAAQLDPAVTRAGERVLLDGAAIDKYRGGIYGVAADIGTTTIVLSCHDLASGKQVGSAALENPQLFGGADVMSRIRYDGRSSEKDLQRVLVAHLNRALADLGVDVRSIYEMTVAGNPTMRDLLFGLNVQSLGRRPFKSVTELEKEQGACATTALTAEAEQLGLVLNQRARVYGLPLIGCHVGADAAAAVAALDLFDEDRCVMVMDIGTNSEIVLGSKKRMIAASCAAGPAFEGRGVRCGMPGLEGAIETVTITEDRVECRTISGAPAQGVCGSGLIDALAELRRTERMDLLGHLTGEDSFVLDEAAGISLDGHDLSALAQAKAAHAAGLHILFKRFGIRLEELDCFYLAGGFANYINVENAIAIGLIPPLPLEKIKQVGNSSSVGAAKALRSISSRRRLEQFVETIEHIALETDPAFFDLFAQGCMFSPLEL
jgi:uncharacterized 2Fe-2S/4Fe-4S cluster protein (DUF4445 family)